MFATYPSTMLRTNQRELKDAARAEPILITDSGDQSYLFSGDSPFRDLLGERQSETTYSQRVMESIDRGMADFAAGRYVVGIDAAMAEVERRKAIYTPSVRS